MLQEKLREGKKERERYTRHKERERDRKKEREKRGRDILEITSSDYCKKGSFKYLKIIC